MKAYRSLDGRPQSAEFVRFEEAGEQGAGSGVVLRVLDRMGRSRERRRALVPQKGDRIVWTLFEHDQRVGPKLPDPEDTPWTHGGRRARTWRRRPTR